MSTMYVDNIVEKTSANGVHIPGHVVQVQNTGWNTTFNTTSQSFTSTGHAVTITPKFASSKIYLNLAGGSWYIEAGTAMTTIYRNSTHIGEATGGLAYKQGNATARYHPHSMSAYDSPNTTNAITYTVYIKSENGTTTYYSYPQYGIMSLVAMEIAQ